MKKMGMLLALCLLLPACAMGEGTGLPEALAALFEGETAYAGYACTASDWETAKGTPGELAVFVMDDGEHRELIAARRGADGYAIEARSSLALWQGEREADWLPVVSVADGKHFSLRFRKTRQTFAFEKRKQAWVLVRADTGTGTYGAVSAELDDWRYTFWQGTDSADWRADELYLDPDTAEENRFSAFNALRFPTSPEGVRHLNDMETLLSSRRLYASDVSAREGYRASYPVYTAPSEKAYRAANGKAQVSLKGGLKAYGTVGGWTLIRYEVSPGVSRVGYIRARGLADEIELAGSWATVTMETTLTDDPLSGQGALMTLKAGETVKCLAQWDAYYAYVQTRKNARAIRGFVPIAALQIPEPEADAEATARLAGTSWCMSGGGTMGADIYRFFADGSCMTSFYDYELPPPEDYPLPEDRASRRVRGWSVSRYDPALGLFWDDDEYMLTLTDMDSGDVVGRYGLSLGETSFGLAGSEGSGAYRLLEEETEENAELAVYPRTPEQAWEMNRVRTLMHDIDCYEGEGSVGATVTREAGVTDACSAAAEAKLTLNAGDEVTCLGCADGAYFARVRGETAGEAFEGYMPISALTIAEPEEDPEGTALLAGTNWFLVESAGYADILRFDEDGVCLASNYDTGGVDADEYIEKIPPNCEPTFVGSLDESITVTQPFPEDEASRFTCRYRVSRYDPEMELFDCFSSQTFLRYMVTFEREDGSIERRGFALDEVSMIMMTGGSKGGYWKMRPKDAPQRQ